MVLSDGWRLPFVQLINWGKVAIALPEAMVQTPELLVAALPTDPHMIGETRDASLRVYDKHFRTSHQKIYLSRCACAESILSCAILVVGVVVTALSSSR